MEKYSWKILFVEDDEDDYLVVSDLLATVPGRPFSLVWESTFEGGLEAAKDCSLDAILVDYFLGPYNGLDLTRQAIEKGCRAPIIVLTGNGSYEMDMQAMKAGATDFLSKSEATPRLLERTIRYAIERKQKEDELESQVRARTHELRQAYEQLSSVVLSLREEIDERKRMETELIELQQRLIDSTEAERLNLAQELHDGPLQDLYGLTYQMDTFRQDLPVEERAALAAASVEKLNQVIHELRAMAVELRPPTLTQFGLEKAIRSHCEHFQRSHANLQIQLQLMADGKKLPERVRLALFRIYQVALTNVARHANANRVDIRLALDAEKVCLEVQDDGCGFQVPGRLIQLVRKGHLGLAGAAERAEAVGGKLELESKPNAGTLLRVVVPRADAN